MPGFVVWGSELSPFALKLRALCDVHRLPYDWLPAHGTTWRNLRLTRAIEMGKRARTIERPLAPSPLDEYPLVPYLITPNGKILYDSSALALWLDREHANPLGETVPSDPELGFVARWIEEGFDELGLYLVHHNRWVVSATSNDAGARLANEYRATLPPGTRVAFGRWFARRQVRRLPYLFSVAPEGFCIAGLSADLTPPSRRGFPQTHTLLEIIWADLVDAIELVLTQQPYLLGERFTVADAAVHGQLAMNLADPTAAQRLRSRAPKTHAWLVGICERQHVGSRGELIATPHLEPLLLHLGDTFAPLMQQNARAYAAARTRGETLFNEAAFERDRSLYDGELRGQPFRSVVKTFQVRTWHDLSTDWQGLSPAQQQRLETLHPFGRYLS